MGNWELNLGRTRECLQFTAVVYNPGPQESADFVSTTTVLKNWWGGKPAALLSPGLKATGRSNQKQFWVMTIKFAGIL